MICLYFISSILIYPIIYLDTNNIEFIFEKSTNKAYCPPHSV